MGLFSKPLFLTATQARTALDRLNNENFKQDLDSIETSIKMMVEQKCSIFHFPRQISPQVTEILRARGFKVDFIEEFGKLYTRIEW
jgi:hypothetical protein